MTPEVALRTYLLSKSDITAIIGNRFSPLKANEEETLPRIVYHQGQRVSEMSLSGKSGCADTLIVLEIHGNTSDYDTCSTLAKAIDTHVDGVGQILFGDLWVQRSKIGEDMQESEEFIPGQDEKCLVFTLEVYLFHDEENE